MSEEKDADELASEVGIEMPALPPIPAQLGTSDGRPRRGEREPGSWCRDNNVTPPEGSFGEGSFVGRHAEATPTPSVPA